MFCNFERGFMEEKKIFAHIWVYHKTCIIVKEANERYF